MGSSLTKQILKVIENIKEGEIFDYADFTVLKNPKTVAIVLCRLFKVGKITRLAKGKYYKPKQSRFGLVPPGSVVILNKFLFRNNEPVGYLTGNMALNRLGLSTQIPNVYEIATNERISPKKSFANTNIRFVKSLVKITKNNAHLLPILDVLRNIQFVSDAKVSDSISRIFDIIDGLKRKDRNLICELVRYYNPRTRALLGALLEGLGDKKNSKELKKSLNPLSNYKLGFVPKILPNARDWNIL